MWASKWDDEMTMWDDDHLLCAILNIEKITSLCVGEREKAIHHLA